MSRTARRAGTKALTCHYCPQSKRTGRYSMKFRGKGRSRFERHLKEVHSK